MLLRFTLIALLGMLSYSPTHAQDVTVDPQLIRKQILDTWNNADKATTTVRSTMVVEFYQARAGEELKLKRTDSIVTAISNEGYLFDYSQTGTELGSTNSRELATSNSLYSATIKKSRPDRDWILGGYTRGQSELTGRQDCVLPWTTLPNVQLAKWLADPLVNTPRVERFDRSGHTVIRVHFTLVDVDGKKPVDGTMQSGYFDFNETSSYCVLGYQVLRKTQFSEGTEICECQYTPSQNIPLLQKAIINRPEIRSAKFGNGSSREVRTYKIDYNIAIPKEEFWLSHYGLPEPIGANAPKPSRRYLWFVLAAVAFAALGVAFRVMSRRRKAEATP